VIPIKIAYFLGVGDFVWANAAVPIMSWSANAIVSRKLMVSWGMIEFNVMDWSL